MFCGVVIIASGLVAARASAQALNDFDPANSSGFARRSGWVKAENGCNH